MDNKIQEKKPYMTPIVELKIVAVENGYGTSSTTEYWDKGSEITF